ncbi:MAG TPA: metallophosphoesterase [Spirochaetia bacterium]|nr:metallophosphoesterase [Spirochaetia bacterium]
MRALDAVASSIEATLQKLFESSPRQALAGTDRIVVLSDFHLGDGSSRDDFLPNGDLLQEVLARYYLPGGWSLILNGDIEELQRFSLESIQRRWASLYELLRAFEGGAAVYRIVGNHDEALWHCGERIGARSLLSSLRLSWGSDTLFVFHGHQATIFFERFNDVSGFFLRHVAHRLHIPNIPVHYESTKRYRTEHRVYGFSSARKIVSVIGHTHRPLFESLSKIDTLRFRIEQLCRDYPTVSPRARRAIETVVEGYRAELKHLWEKDRRDGLRSGLYNEQLSVPCLFNSGCAIGKRGLTAIEIAEGQIALVHWFDRNRSDRYLPGTAGRQPAAAVASADGDGAWHLEGTEYYRTVLKKDRLDYIFARIRLLA